MIEVEAPDGTIVEFPDGTSRETMTTAMAKAFPPQKGAPSTTEDVLRTIPAGLARGVAGLVGLPGSAMEWVGEGVNWLGEKAGYQKRNLPESPLMPSAQTVTNAIETQTGPLYQPQTRPGRYVNTVSEFAPAALGPGGTLGNLLKYAAVPGVVSEGAGELAQKVAPSLEGPARAIGAIVPAAAAAALTRPTTGQVINQYARGATPQQLQQAEALFSEAQQLGMPITRAEAIQYVSQGSTKMGDLLRVLEGQGELKSFFAQRPQQNEQAFTSVVRDIQPQPTSQPSTIGPQAGITATETLNDVRGTINRASQPYYNAAESVRLSPQEMQQVRQVPGIEQAIAAVRGDPQLNRYVSHLPDDSVGFLNEVKKWFDQQKTNAAVSQAGTQNKQRSAGFEADANTVRSIAENASPDYAAALQIQSQARQRYLDPLLQGPLGRLAEKDIPTQRAIEALFPRSPVPNSADEISTAIAALTHRRPHVARDLVRAHLESTFNDATRNLISGPNQFGGAKFASVIRGNPQQAANLEAAIRALPNGDALWTGADRYLRIVEAQGTRQRPGSMTSFNNEMLQDLRTGSTAGTVAKNTLSFTKIPSKIAETWERWRLGSNTADLARLLTDPRAAREFQRLASVPAGSAQAVMLATRLTNMSFLAPRH